MFVQVPPTYWVVETVPTIPAVTEIDFLPTAGVYGGFGESNVIQSGSGGFGVDFGNASGFDNEIYYNLSTD